MVNEEHVNEEHVKWAKLTIFLNTNCGLLDYKIKDLEKVLRENYSLKSNEVEECIKYLEETGFIMYVEKERQIIKLK